MSVHGARGQLKESMKELLIRWDIVREKWDDPAARAFEKDFLLPLEPAANKAVSAMDEMAEILRRVKRECG